MRYRNNGKGSFKGLQPGLGTLMLRTDKALPGLRNFYMIGQWVEPGGGLPPSIMPGGNVTRIICKKDRKRFTAQVGPSLSPMKEEA